MKGMFLLLGLLKPHWKSVVTAIILAFLTVGSNVGLMAVSALLIARAALHPPVLELMTLVAGVRFFGISRAVFRYLERYLTHDVTFRLLSEIRVWFYKALEPLAPDRLAGYRSGDLYTRMVADVDTLKDFYLRIVAPPLAALMVMAAVVILLAAFHPELAAVFILFYLMAGAAVPLGIGLAGRGLNRRLLEVRAGLNTHLVDTIRGMTEIISFGRAGARRDGLGELSREMAGLQQRIACISGLSSALTGLLMNLALWSVLLLGTRLVSRGELEGIYLALVALAVISSFEALLPLSMVFHHAGESNEAARRLFRFVRNRETAGNITEMKGEFTGGPDSGAAAWGITARNLGFAYHSGEFPVLKGIDFDLPPGGRLAVVGPSGAGKSTLVNILLGFLDYKEGSLRLGHREVASYHPDELRASLGVVTQHTHLFNATIRENLLLANPRAGEAEMMEAAAGALIHDFIAALPDGYDTPVGEGGFRLSGGQRQRLALARTLLKGAPVLILDEATAGLDPVRERDIMEGFYELARGRTTLVISHRLAGLEKMDEILVLDRGQVVERGTHRELVDRGGLYRRMWELQRQVLAG